MAALVPEEVQVLTAASPDLALIAARSLKRGRNSQANKQAATQSTPRASHAAGLKSHVRKWIDWLSWWLHIPDTRIGWILPAVVAGLRQAKRARPAVIYATAPAWSSHVVGLILSHLLRVPLVADFQDPWCGSYWHKVPYRAHRWLDELLEKMVVRRARQIPCAWDGIRRHLEARYPKRREDIHTILNGFSSEEIEAVAPVRLDEQRCVLLHAGVFYGPRRPEPLLSALRQLQTDSPDIAQNLLVALVGRPEYAGRPLQEIAREFGVEDLVAHHFPGAPP